MPLSQCTRISHFPTSLKPGYSNPYPTFCSTFAILKNTSASQILATALHYSPLLLFSPLPTGKYYIIHRITGNEITSWGKESIKDRREERGYTAAGWHFPWCLPSIYYMSQGSLYKWLIYGKAVSHAMYRRQSCLLFLSSVAFLHSHSFPQMVPELLGLLLVLFFCLPAKALQALRRPEVRQQPTLVITLDSAESRK